MTLTTREEEAGNAGGRACGTAWQEQRRRASVMRLQGHSPKQTYTVAIAQEERRGEGRT